MPTIETRIERLSKLIAEATAELRQIQRLTSGEQAGELSATRISIIRRLVADRFGITEEAMLINTRRLDIVKPRQIAMWACRLLTKHSLEGIGHAFGGRDHGTVIFAFKSIEDRCATDAAFKAEALAILAAARKAIENVSEPLLVGVAPLPNDDAR